MKSIIIGQELFYHITMSMLHAHPAGQPCLPEDMPGKWEFKEEILKNTSLQVKSI